jgi:nicotinate dehydrogenase subunit B
MTHSPRFRLSRRDLLKSAGALVVGVSLPTKLLFAADAVAATGKPPLVPDQLDSWLAVHQDNTATAYFGKVDLGQGVEVGVAQIVAEELDLAVDKVRVVMGDTALTLNHGGASGSTGIQNGAKPLRNAAAEARRILLDMAGRRLGAPADQLTVIDGVVSAPSGEMVTYGRLIGGGYFHAPMEWNGKYGNALAAKGQAKPKSPSQYKVVGQSVPRRDVADKVYGRLDYVTDVRVPGMLHGRTIRPPVAGAVPVAVDEASIRNIPGVRVVWRQGFLGVVAEREWNAIRAARELKVRWSDVPGPFPDQAALYDHIRKAPVTRRKVETSIGSVDQALSSAAKVISAEYEWPFQSHSCMGPACAVVDIGKDKVTLWTGSQKPHYAAQGVAGILRLPADKVHGIWVPGPGSYGRNDAGDAAIDAAVLAQAVGRPVRLQYMRDEGHGWDPKSPASIHRVKAGLDAQGNIIAYQYESKAFSRMEVASHDDDPRDSLAGQSMGLPPKPEAAFGTPEHGYRFPNAIAAWETIPPLLDRASPLRTSHLRDPLGPQMHFAFECFIDELAAAAGVDPVEYRLRHLDKERDIAVVKAAAERARWERRPAGPRRPVAGDVLKGHGIAYAQRHGTIVAVVAEVEVERATGQVRTPRFVVAHDCGCIVNPGALKLTIEGNIVHATSRALWEEVTFDRNMVTSTTWLKYPILDIEEAPRVIDIVLIDHPELPPTGAGEPSSRPVAAAIANAVYDATGVRLRRAPFRAETVKAALTSI